MNIFLTNVAYADGLDDFLHKANTVILNPLIKLLFAVALIYFLYGVLEFIMNQENEEKKTEGKSHMVWGIIGMSIMFSVWGIMIIILNTIGVTGINPIDDTVHLNDYNPTFPELKTK